MIAERFDVFLFDLDGVIYRGDEALPHAISTVNRLRDQDKQVRFLTNDPRSDRETIAERLRNLGLDVALGEIVTSASATAVYLSREGIATASVVGSDGLRAELRCARIAVTDDDPEAVVVGADEQTTYSDIRRAARQIHREATFIGTNPDGSFPTPQGPAPGTGAIVRAVEVASGTRPTTIGKPEPLMFEMALKDVPAEFRPVVVGDNPSTDILGAHRAGITGVLVASDSPDIGISRDFRRPEATIETLADLYSIDVEAWQHPSHGWPDECRPGVGAVVLNQDDQVLLLMRADTEQWALPTGSLERCESVETAIRREIREETGLDVTIKALTGVYSNPQQQVFSYPSGRTVHFITNCFLCRVKSEKLDLDADEVLDADYFDPECLPGNILPMQPRWIFDALESSNQAVIR